MTTLPTEVSATQLATILGVGRRKVSELDKAGVIPKNEAGKFPLAPAVAAYIAHRLAEARRDPGDTFKDKYAFERARKLRIENDLRDRKLVRLDEADDTLMWFVGQTRVDLQSVPARVSDDITDRRAAEAAIDRAFAQASAIMEINAKRFRHDSGNGVEPDQAMRETQDAGQLK